MEHPGSYFSTHHTSEAIGSISIIISTIVTFTMQFPAVSLLQSPLSFILEHTGVILAPHQVNQNLNANGAYLQTQLPNSSANYGTSNTSDTGEFSIQITENIGGNHLRVELYGGFAFVSSTPFTLNPDSRHLVGDVVWDGPDASDHRIDVRRVGRWKNQILPILLLLLVVFIHQHLQGGKSGVLALISIVYA